MLGRLLDPDDPVEVGEHLARLTFARLTANSAYRFAAPFLATIAAGLDVGLAAVGVALAVSELGGLAAPALGRWADRLPRRAAMTGALLGVAGGAALAGVSPNVAGLAAGLLGVSLSKIVFDVSLAGWVADRIPYQRRARALGLTETSWAGSMLVGVPLMGLVAAAASWRWSYAVVALALVVVAARLQRRLPAAPGHVAGHGVGRGPRAPLGTGWLVVGAAICLMASSQCLFVVYGPWLADRFGFGEVAISAVSVVLGLGELAAALGTSRFTDRLGKARAVRFGTIVMLPAALVLAVGEGLLAVGLVALVAFIVGFEFAIVSMIPLGTELVPGRPAAGLGVVIGAGTLGRAAMAVPATAGFDATGIWLPALAAALLALGCTSFVTAYGRRHPGA